MIFRIRQPQGIALALVAASLFGISAPLAKVLLGHVSPWMLAGLLYAGSGVGLWCYRSLSKASTPVLSRADGLWLLLAILSGGVVAPVLMMYGLLGLPASRASLILNAEVVMTAVLAWLVFKEHVSARILWGMLAIAAGTWVLGLEHARAPHPQEALAVRPTAAMILACLAWAVDNNLTRKVSLNDASFIAMTKGLVAGSTNGLLAWTSQAAWPDWDVIGWAAALGFVSYGISLALFVVALRQLGVARSAACFAVAPFFGAVVAIPLLGEPVSWALLVAGGLMVWGVYLHVSESHVHEHTHEASWHEHMHVHDEHHQHAHGHAVSMGSPHVHAHHHPRITHKHPHFPDMHHQHAHP